MLNFPGATTNECGEYPISTEINESHHGYIYYHEGRSAGFYVLYHTPEVIFNSKFFKMKSGG